MEYQTFISYELPGYLIVVCRESATAKEAAHKRDAHTRLSKRKKLFMVDFYYSLNESGVQTFPTFW